MGLLRFLRVGKQIQMLALLLAAGAGSACHHGASLADGKTPGEATPPNGQVTLLATGPSGWSDFTPSIDSRLIYVSSSAGDDSNSGLSEAHPKRTIAAAKTMLRHGFPDWLLLRRGDVWTEGLGQWRCSGRSAGEMMVVTSYGPSIKRPLLLTGNSHGVFTNTGAGSPQEIHHVAFLGLELTPHLYTGVGSISGFSWLIGSENILIEDCCIHHYGNNLVLQGFSGWCRDIKVRRNIIWKSFSTSSNNMGQGLYASGCRGLLIEENVFYHNGWDNTVPGSGPNMFRHAMYLQTGPGNSHNYNVTVLGNIVADSSATGIQLRCGGVCEDNLFLGNPINAQLGGGTNPRAEGVDCGFSRNVILDSRDIDITHPRGWSVSSSNLSSAKIQDNLIAHQDSGRSPRAVDFNSTVGVGVQDVVFSGNVIYNWSDAGCLMLVGQKFNGVNLIANHFQENRARGSQPLYRNNDALSVPLIHTSNNVFHSNANLATWFRIGPTNMTMANWRTRTGDHTSVALQVPYPDPSRNIASYHQRLGAAPSLEAFMAEAMLQSRHYWRPEYTAVEANRYFREGFGM